MASPSQLDDAGDAVRRLVAMADEYGMTQAGKLGDVAGPVADVRPEDWLRAQKRISGKSPHTLALVADPVRLAASQYPSPLRDEATAIASEEGFQNVLPGQKIIVGAHPTRNSLFSLGSGQAGGYAHYRPRHPSSVGLIEIAAGSKVPDDDLRRALFHEARHMIEQGDLGSALYPLDSAYEESAGLLRSRGKFPAGKFEYLSNPSEEMARLGDLRARYAGLTGKLIYSPDEAEQAMQLMAKNTAGVGDGFLPDERDFYMAGRSGSPEIRERQDWLLQRLLAVPGAGIVAATATSDKR